MLRDLLQEVRELGLRGTAFRASWEARKRSGALARVKVESHRSPWLESGQWMSRLPFPDPVTVVEALRARIAPTELAALEQRALDATHGRIRCFGRWDADYGDPIDWHVNPVNGQRWSSEAPWSGVLSDEPRVGDVKLTWEIARFPHAFEMARAASFNATCAPALASALLSQFESFTRSNPYGLGVHWASGQETAIRMLAWTFAHDVLLSRGTERERAGRVVADALAVGAQHIVHHLDYARIAVFNNHLLYEALGLYLAGVLLGDEDWRRVGREILIAEADRQFYADGAYIQQSHNYHRVALQSLMCACLFAKAGGESVHDSWLRAMDRSLEFLLQHQNPVDGRLPNYGGNDGAHPLLLSTCDYSDFRPALQAVSVLVRGKRVYDPGPWDESAAWLFGAKVLDVPLERPKLHSVSFAQTGFHVLRSADEQSFAAFRCGTLRDRFSQIDMLHLDVWWRGLNVLVDPGSYLYNGPPAWHDHFLQTASHNTVVVDGHDQMLHFRRFKTLYRTKARVFRFEDNPTFTYVAGEHEGFTRHSGGVVHRRSVLFLKDELWVVVDHLRGRGTHHARLHWLAGESDATTSTEGRLRLDTPRGTFSLAVFNDRGTSLTNTVVSGGEDPPRGWVSRYYGERVATASLVVEQEGPLPVTFVTVMGTGLPTLRREKEQLVVSEGDRVVRLRVQDGLISLLEHP